MGLLFLFQRGTVFVVVVVVFNVGLLFLFQRGTVVFVSTWDKILKGN